MIFCLPDLGLNTHVSFAPFLVASIIHRNIPKQASLMKESKLVIAGCETCTEWQCVRAVHCLPEERGRRSLMKTDLPVAAAHCYVSSHWKYHYF